MTLTTSKLQRLHPMSTCSFCRAARVPPCDRSLLLPILNVLGPLTSWPSSQQDVVSVVQRTEQDPGGYQHVQVGSPQGSAPLSVVLTTWDLFSNELSRSTKVLVSDKGWVSSPIVPRNVLLFDRTIRAS